MNRAAARRSSCAIASGSKRAGTATRSSWRSDIAGAFGRGTYDSISYRLATDEHGRQGVEVTPVDSSLGRLVFRAGLQINDDFEGTDDYQLNLESRLTGLNSKGAEWRTFLGIGRVASIATDSLSTLRRTRQLVRDSRDRYAALNQPLIVDGIDVAEYRVESWFGACASAATSAIGCGSRPPCCAVRTGGCSDRLAGAARAKSDIGGVDVNVLWDSLDNVKFPRRGVRAEISYNHYRDLGSDADGDLMRVAIDAPFSFGRNTLMLGGRASRGRSVNAFQTEPRSAA